MSERNIVQTTFDEFGKASGAVKKSGSWYRRANESIFVFNLQKSNYARRYFGNVAVWLLAAGPADAPKPSSCHIQTRLEMLVPSEVAPRLNALLDLESPIDVVSRREELLRILREHLLPLMTATATLALLRVGEGERLLRASLINRDGQRVLGATQ